MVFRERGIYSLPNGRELVVLRNDEEGSVLFDPVSSERIEMGEVLINKAGRLVYHGKLTAWDITNLTDTGRTSRDIPVQSKDRVPQSELNR
jgi:VCBS repeat-containing protein